MSICVQYTVSTVLWWGTRRHSHKPPLSAQQLQRVTVAVTLSIPLWVFIKHLSSITVSSGTSQAFVGSKLKGKQNSEWPTADFFNLVCFYFSTHCCGVSALLALRPNTVSTSFSTVILDLLSMQSPSSDQCNRHIFSIDSGTNSAWF